MEWRPTVRRYINRKSGTTLVEMIVTFALLAIFMMSATFMIISGLNLFARMQSDTKAVVVSDLLLDKIVGEITAAEVPVKNGSGYYFWLAEEAGGSWIVCGSRSKHPIAIFAAESTGAETANDLGRGQLFIRYYELAGVEAGGTGEMDWHFDKSAYMDYTIDKLQFSQPDAGDHPNVIKIELSLINTRTGQEYSAWRYAENYNFDFESDYMCMRSDGNDNFPVRAEEFRILDHQ